MTLTGLSFLLVCGFAAAADTWTTGVAVFTQGPLVSERHFASSCTGQDLSLLYYRPWDALWLWRRTQLSTLFDRYI